MQPEEIAAHENAVDVIAIANAMLAARDPRRTAAGLITIAEFLVEDDLIGRLALAEIMREAADKLDVRIH
jgi:hypothetical protein